jgi:hypothetical protein
MTVKGPVRRNNYLAKADSGSPPFGRYINRHL